MTKLDKLPDQEKIDQFKGKIDFYLWKGIPVARRWPKWEPRGSTPAEASNQAAFRYINQIFQSLPPVIKDAYRQMAAQTTRTNKDVAVSLYMMGATDDMPPDYFASEETQLAIKAVVDLIDAVLTAKLDVALSTRALEAGGNLAAILTKLDVALSTRALEAGGNLADIKTAAQLIDDLRGALGAVATDHLRVSRVSGGISNAVAQESKLVKTGAGKVWWITTACWGTAISNVLVYDGTSAAGTLKWYGINSAGASLHAVFDPPIDCATGIYIYFTSSTTAFSLGYS